MYDIALHNVSTVTLHRPSMFRYIYIHIPQYLYRLKGPQKSLQFNIKDKQQRFRVACAEF